MKAFDCIIRHASAQRRTTRREYAYGCGGRFKNKMVETINRHFNHAHDCCFHSSSTGQVNHLCDEFIYRAPSTDSAVPLKWLAASVSVNNTVQSILLLDSIA